MGNDQAERLRDKATNSEVWQTGSLPSRKEVHQRKKENDKKKKKKDKNPEKQSLLLTRFLLVAFILLIGLMVTYQFWSNNVYFPVHSDDKKDIQQVKIEK